MSGDAEPWRVNALLATSSLLDALRARPVLGRGLTPDDDRPGAPTVALLGNELWRTRFGADSGVVGRTLRLDGEDVRVVGVAGAGFRFPSNASTGMILSLNVPPEAPAARKSGWTFAVGRLKPGMTIDAATAELGALSRRMEREHPESNQGSTYYTVPLRDDEVGMPVPPCS